ncbi:hypothetical protein [Nocardia sp. NPDC058705]
MSSKPKVFTVEVFGLSKSDAEKLIRETLAGHHTYTVHESENA